MPDSITSLCNRLSKNVVSRTCAIKGGIKKRAWVFQLDDIKAAKTYGTDGALSGFMLKSGVQGITATGRPKKGNGSNKLSQSEEGATNVEQSLLMEFGYSNQAEMDAILELLAADGKVVFIETNSGDIRVYFREFGAETFEGEDGTGTALGDASNVVKATLKGNEPALPMFFKAPISGQLSQLASSTAYLDALCGVEEEEEEG